VAGAGDDSDPAVADTSAPDDDAPPARGKGPRQIRTGDRLGRYEIGEELGEGGMATVFRARDRELRREVAVKVLFPHLARRDEIVRRFHREARAAAALEHANILRIYDVGEAGGDDPPYIVMELIRGRTLLEEVEARGAMLAEVVACVGALLADALAAAHAAGVIHRDVKPGNVLIAPGGKLLLADFGVARLETEDSLVTRTGALLGTPAYMSPEQASGDVTTARSDLYSLGATLYQLATGSLPYAGAPAKMMAQIAAGAAVAPVRRRPACGLALSRLIERMMAVDPDARPGGAAALAGELRALAAAGGFGDPGEELAAYFKDPAGFVAARTPALVARLVGAARDEAAAGRLPRAMALADRASALAPDDPAVTALVRTVAEGGHASRRNRAMVIAGAVVVLAGGGGALAWRALRAPGATPPDAGVVSSLDVGPLTASDAAPRAVLDGIADAAPGAPAEGALLPSRAPAGAPIDAAPAPSLAPVDAAAPAALPASTAPVDAGVRLDAGSRPRDAGGRDAGGRDAGGRDAGAVDAAPLDAAIAHDAAVDAPASAPAVGYVIVRNDLWCNITIDGVDRGNRRNERLEVTPGHHTVRCVNPAGTWSQEADVAAGETRTLTGAPLREIEVRLEVDATIDGKPYARGAVVRFKPSNLEVIAGGKKQFITFRASCRLRDVPALGCYL
jgi:serine/threonine-protein kinase